jgi:hypothetical protein
MKWQACLVAAVALITLIVCTAYWAVGQHLQKMKARAVSLAERLELGTAPPLPGEQILAQYASATTRPEDDLIIMAHAISNLILLIKGGNPFHMGANEEFAAALLGKNRDRLRFVNQGHRCFNAKGQIVDRWMTPLFFHVNEHSRIDIRSAGPDQIMWTEDDLMRRHDGQFLYGIKKK